MLLANVVGTSRLMPDDLRCTRLPLASTRSRNAWQREVDDLLLEGRALVEAVERLVCRLYGVPDPLTELVVLSAVTRAGTVAQTDD